MSFTKSIQHLDELGLNFIHNTCGNSFFDFVLPFMRNPFFWAPLYLFILVWMWQQFGVRGLWWCAFFFVTFVFSDFISASLIKPWVHRLRPCNNNNLFFTVRALVPCGSGFSFPSSHAANHFGMSLYIMLTIGHKSKWITPLALFWASSICYAQLYVCVHYPSDILCGSLLGVAIGSFFAMYHNKRFGMLF